MHQNESTDKSIKALKAYVSTYYADNSFFIDFPELFFKLWLLIKTNKKDWLEKLTFECEFIDVKKWINSLFLDKNNEFVLYVEDKVKLVLNNITKLPDNCKCHLKNLKADVVI